MLFKVTTLILDALLYTGSECYAGGDDIVFRHALPCLDDGGLENFDVAMGFDTSLDPSCRPDGEI